ncbi:MAG: SIMPL domain-containing protein [bacterium]|nr:SIMPL domain-containing protein [bacterium]
MKNLLAVILSLFLIALIVSIVIDINDKLETSENVITVSDTGTVYAKPDLGLVTATVLTEAETVAESMAENTEKMNAVISAVKGQGVEEKDLKTTSFNIYPRYEWRDRTEIYPEGQRTLVGYEIRQSLEVKIRDLTAVGSIIQAATTAGANQMSDLQLVIDNQEEIKKQAREQAIEKAKAKAAELAEQLGIKLVSISNFSESGVVPSYANETKSLAPAAMGGAEMDTAQIAVGENKIEITVYITYKIK